jgi:hypothetical protein
VITPRGKVSDTIPEFPVNRTAWPRGSSTGPAILIAPVSQCLARDAGQPTKFTGRHLKAMLLTGHHFRSVTAPGGKIKMEDVGKIWND